MLLIMAVLILGAAGTADGSMRLVLLLVLIVAVVLIVTGAVIATVTLSNVRKTTHSQAAELESERN